MDAAPWLVTISKDTTTPLVSASSVSDSNQMFISRHQRTLVRLEREGESR